MTWRTDTAAMWAELLYYRGRERLDEDGFTDAADVKRRITVFGRGGVWRTLTAEEAGSFWRAYEVGIMHPTEILRAVLGFSKATVYWEPHGGWDKGEG